MPASLLFAGFENFAHSRKFLTSFNHGSTKTNEKFHGYCRLEPLRRLSRREQSGRIVANFSTMHKAQELKFFLEFDVVPLRLEFHRLDVARTYTVRAHNSNIRKNDRKKRCGRKLCGVVESTLQFSDGLNSKYLFVSFVFAQKFERLQSNVTYILVISILTEDIQTSDIYRKVQTNVILRPIFHVIYGHFCPSRFSFNFFRVEIFVKLRNCCDIRLTMSWKNCVYTTNYIRSGRYHEIIAWRLNDN